MTSVAGKRRETTADRKIATREAIAGNIGEIIGYHLFIAAREIEGYRVGPVFTRQINATVEPLCLLEIGDRLLLGDID